MDALELLGLKLPRKDTGAGMDDATQKRVFEPFFSTKGAQGTGLNLGISRKIAQLYGDDIAFQSQAGQGTTFRLSLPQPGSGA